MRRILIVDDQMATRRALRAVLAEKDTLIFEADSLFSAKLLARALHRNGKLDLIVSDYDLGASLIFKYRLFDGFRFLRWGAVHKISDKLILHSSVFELHKRFGLFVHKNLLGVFKRARRFHIQVQPKSNLLGEGTSWKCP